MKIGLKEKIRNVYGLLQRMQKETIIASVPGVAIVREDLGIRHPKKRPTLKGLSHGQRHREPKKQTNSTVPTNGQGDFSQSEVPLRSGAEGSRP